MALFNNLERMSAESYVLILLLDVDDVPKGTISISAQTSMRKSMVGAYSDGNLPEGELLPCYLLELDNEEPALPRGPPHLTIGQALTKKTPELLAEGNRWFDEGASQIEVSKTLGIAEPTVRKWFPGRGMTPEQARERIAIAQQERRLNERFILVQQEQEERRLKERDELRIKKGESQNGTNHRSHPDHSRDTLRSTHGHRPYDPSSFLDL